MITLKDPHRLLSCMCRLIVHAYKKHITNTIDLQEWIRNCTLSQSWACFVYFSKLPTLFRKTTCLSSRILQSSWSKLYKKLKYGVKVSVHHIVFELLIKACKIIMINNSKTAWPTEILMSFWVSLTSFNRIEIVFLKVLITFR